MGRLWATTSPLARLSNLLSDLHPGQGAIAPISASFAGVSATPVDTHERQEHKVVIDRVGSG
jgi:hypothetical protein